MTGPVGRRRGERVVDAAVFARMPLAARVQAWQQGRLTPEQELELVRGFALAAPPPTEADTERPDGERTPPPIRPFPSFEEFRERGLAPEFDVEAGARTADFDLPDGFAERVRELGPEQAGPPAGVGRRPATAPAERGAGEDAAPAQAQRARQQRRRRGQLDAATWTEDAQQPPGVLGR